MKTFIITTLGCKVNQYETAAIAAGLEDLGWKATARNKPADLCIINTCTVTQKAAMQSRQAIRQALRANPGAFVVVTGCYAQTEATALEKIQGIDLIVGHAEKLKLPHILQQVEQRKSAAPVTLRPDVYRITIFDSPPAPVIGRRTRPVLKIQDGCNAFCTYCIVPHARGRSRSMPPTAVAERVRQLKSIGCREVVLSGIHLGCYGQDLSPATSLLALLREIDAGKMIERVRISSIEPLEISDEIIELAAGSSIICPHFHVPLQSGDDAVLARMRRPYSRSFFRERILTIHKRIPAAAIGADVLVGFPGETRQAFENTCRLIEDLPLTYLHVFPFSARAGTPASQFSDTVADREIRSRCRRLREIGSAKKEAFYRANLGKTFPALIESRRDRRSGRLQGFTPNYIPVRLDGEDRLKNTIAAIRTVRISDGETVLAALCPASESPLVDKSA